MKDNPERFQALLISPIHNMDPFPNEILIQGVAMQRLSNVKLLWINIDERLSFDEHIKQYV